MKKRIIVGVILIIIMVMNINTVFGESDSYFSGRDTATEELDDLEFIAEEANLTTFQDGEITSEDLDFSRVHKIYIDTLPYFFNGERVTAGSLKELLNNADYVYYMPIYREHEPVFLTIAKGLELNPDVTFTDEEKAWVLERVGRWFVSQVRIPDDPQNPSFDYMGLMESYLEYKNIHNSEVYFISRINPKSMITAAVITGKQNEQGEDEIIFVAVDTLQYDESGNLISVEPYKVYDDGDFEIEDAEYTYEELRELSKEFDLNPGMAGGGGGRAKRVNYGVYIAIAVGVIVLIGTIIVLAKKKARR